MALRELASIGITLISVDLNLSSIQYKGETRLTLKTNMHIMGYLRMLVGLWKLIIECSGEKPRKGKGMTQVKRRKKRSGMGMGGYKGPPHEQAASFSAYLATPCIWSM